MIDKDIYSSPIFYMVNIIINSNVHTFHMYSCKSQVGSPQINYFYFHFVAKCAQTTFMT